MSATEIIEKYHESEQDGVRDRYLMMHAENASGGPLIVYLHSGLSSAKQGVCTDSQWCAGTLGEIAIEMGGAYIAPDYRGDSWLNAAAEADLASLIGEIKAQFASDSVIIAGTSMGGTSAILFAALHPDIADGVIALCPATDMTALYNHIKELDGLIYRQVEKSIANALGGTPDEAPCSYIRRSSIYRAHNLTMPIYILHGDSDDIIPIEHSRSLAEKLRGINNRMMLVEMPNGGHDSPVDAIDWRAAAGFVIQK